MDFKIISKEDYSDISMPEILNYLKYEADDTNEEYSLIQSMLFAAAEAVENRCNIMLRPAVIDAYFDDFDIDEGSVILPIAPFSSIIEVVNVDSIGGETAATYSQTKSNLCEVNISAWYGGKIRIKYNCGYGIEAEGEETESAPEIAKQAIYKTVANWFENRDTETILSGEVRRMLNQISYAPWI